MQPLFQHRCHQTSCIPYYSGSGRSNPAGGSLVDILVADNLADNLAEDNPVDNLAGIQVDSSLPEVRIVAGPVKNIRSAKGWSSRFEVEDSGNKALEKVCGLGRGCRDRRLDGLGLGKLVVDPEERISITSFRSGIGRKHTGLFDMVNLCCYSLKGSQSREASAQPLNMRLSKYACGRRRQ